jgi:hypothetical protein
LRHDWGFSREPENSMRRLAQIRLLIIDDFALQPMDATETADANILTHQHRQTTSRVEPSKWSRPAANDKFAHILRVGGGSLWLPAMNAALSACGTDGRRRIGENRS